MLISVTRIQRKSGSQTFMRILKKALARALVLCVTILCQAAQSPQGARQLRLLIQGDSSRLADFVADCKREFPQHGLDFILVRAGAEYDYNIVIAQESSVGGAASAVIALDRSGNFVASVVRSGRWSGKGALNASAKELAKKLAVLDSPKSGN
jgi:hypothetical protein